MGQSRLIPPNPFLGRDRWDRLLPIGSPNRPPRTLIRDGRFVPSPVRHSPFSGGMEVARAQRRFRRGAYVSPATARYLRTPPFLAGVVLVASLLLCAAPSLRVVAVPVALIALVMGAHYTARLVGWRRALRTEVIDLDAWGVETRLRVLRVDALLAAMTDPGSAALRHHGEEFADWLLWMIFHFGDIATTTSHADRVASQESLTRLLAEFEALVQRARQDGLVSLPAWLADYRSVMPVPF